MEIGENIRHIKVFLASASDVANERSSVERTINQENQIHYQKQGCHFDCVRWERDSVPDNERWQDVLNRLIDSCNIFVTLVWGRLGEGTLEEFEYALKRQNESEYLDIIVLRRIDPYLHMVDESKIEKFFVDLRTDHSQVICLDYKVENFESELYELNYRIRCMIANWFYKKNVVKPKGESMSKPKNDFKNMNRGF